jgi:hypothetical protein
LVAYRLAIASGLTNADTKPPYKDWIGEFRKPLSSKLESLPITTTSHMFNVVKAIVDGLVETGTSSITMYSSSSCIACIRWKANELPRLLKLGWQFTEVKVDQVEVHRFEVVYKGKKFEHSFTGYMDSTVLSNIVEELK